MESIFFLLGIGLIFGIAAWFLFIWAVRSGQFDDTEAPKYRMLDDDDDEKQNRPKKKFGKANK